MVECFEFPHQAWCSWTDRDWRVHARAGHDSAHNSNVTNQTGDWARKNLPTFEEFYAAIEQMTLEAGAAGDSVKETGSIAAAAPSVDIARERVANATLAVRACPPPPDADSAKLLARMLDALDEFRDADEFDEWVQAWTRAMDLSEAFTQAFARANGQR